MIRTGLRSGAGTLIFFGDSVGVPSRLIDTFTPGWVAIFRGHELNTGETFSVPGHRMPPPAAIGNHIIKDRRVSHTRTRDHARRSTNQVVPDIDGAAQRTFHIPQPRMAASGASCRHNDSLPEYILSSLPISSSIIVLVHGGIVFGLIEKILKALRVGAATVHVHHGSSMTDARGSV